jgi:predicted RNase H-like nuclease
VRFLGVDLAWKPRNPSGVVALEGTRFPLRLIDGPRTLPTHAAVLDWLAGWLASAGPRPATAIGIDAPLLGLDCARGRRDCDDEVSRLFGRFAASVHSLSAFRDMLQCFAGQLDARCAGADLCPESPAGPGRAVIREVYPNALQVHLFDLDRTPGRTKHAYKRHRFGSKGEWVARGLGPFIEQCIRVIEERRYVARDPAWQALVRRRPRADAQGRALKAIEDGWDALLCALAVALEHLDRGVMRAYTGAGPGAWRRGYILAPVLSPASVRSGATRRACVGRRPGNTGTSTPMAPGAAGGTHGHTGGEGGSVPRPS